MIPPYLYLFLCLELIAVSWIDLKTQKISNGWTLLNIFLFFVLVIVLPQNYFFKLQTFFYSTVFLVVGFGLFLLKIMGGGDVKFLFSFFLLIPLALQETCLELLLYSTLFIGGVFLLVNFISHRKKVFLALAHKDIHLLKTCFGTKFSFAPVILVSWIWLGWKIKAKLI